MFHHLTSDQQALTLAMGKISEEACSAGWMLGLEFAIWHLLESGKKEYGRYILSDADRQKLCALSDRCGGWIAFDDKDGEVFVPLDEWKVKYSEGAARHLDAE
jgi:hypothetical protein